MAPKWYELDRRKRCSLVTLSSKELAGEKTSVMQSAELSIGNVGGNHSIQGRRSDVHGTNGIYRLAWASRITSSIAKTAPSNDVGHQIVGCLGA